MSGRAPSRWPLAAAVAAVVALGAAPALASEASDERAGRALLTAVEAGKRDCASLSTADFELIGDYAMGRMLGSTSAHESMDRLMRDMMGERLERSAHVVMGRRFAGCGGTGADAGFAGMMGMMGGVYGAGPGGMMGGAYGAGRGGMMGRSGYGVADDDWDGGEIVMVVLMGALLLLLLGGLLAWRPWRASGGAGPLEILRDRFARGEIDEEEYERRRQALGGSA